MDSPEQDKIDLSNFPDFPQPEQHHTIFSAIFIEGGLALFALVVGYFCGFSPARTLSWSFGDVVAGFGATVPMLVLFVFLDRSTSPRFVRIQVLVKSFIRTFFGRCSNLQILLICILAGIGEELFFRGLLQDGIAHGIGGTIGLFCGILVSAVLFGFAHLITVTYGIIAFWISIYFAAIFILSDNILVPILAHTLYDYCVIRFLLRTELNK